MMRGGSASPTRGGARRRRGAMATRRVEARTRDGAVARLRASFFCSDGLTGTPLGRTGELAAQHTSLGEALPGAGGQGKAERALSVQ
jgi:hypothetical protein